MFHIFLYSVGLIFVGWVGLGGLCAFLLWEERQSEKINQIKKMILKGAVFICFLCAIFNMIYFMTEMNKAREKAGRHAINILSIMGFTWSRAQDINPLKMRAERCVATQRNLSGNTEVFTMWKMEVWYAL